MMSEYQKKSSFVFQRLTKVEWVWNDVRVTIMIDFFVVVKPLNL